jgi:hypothetical protein
LLANLSISQIIKQVYGVKGGRKFQEANAEVKQILLEMSR